MAVDLENLVEVGAPAAHEPVATQAVRVETGARRGFRCSDPQNVLAL
jgi:hypothetical protein